MAVRDAPLVDPTAHWIGADDDRAFHDHPWSFTTFVLKGGYTDFSPTGAEHLGAGAIAHRPAEHRHTVVPDPGGAWTIIVTGPKTRTWGFWADGVKFIKANKWFASRGHHPCDRTGRSRGHRDDRREKKE